MFIDIHAHAYRRPVPFVVQFCSVKELIQRYDEADIERGMVLPIVSPEIYLPQANEDILDMALEYPDRIIPFCNIDPRALTNSADAPLDRLLHYYKDKGCKGVGEIMLNLPVMHPLVQNLFKHAENVGLPVTCDGSDMVGGDFGLYDEVGMPQLEHTLQRFPKLQVIGHGWTFWAELGRLETPAERKPPFRPDGNQAFFAPSGKFKEEGVVATLLRRHQNLWGELSDAATSLARDDEYGPKFLTEFQDRLMFGTDICHKDHVFTTRQILLDWRSQGKISEIVFNKIAKENAVRFFNL